MVLEKAILGMQSKFGNGKKSTFFPCGVRSKPDPRGISLMSNKYNFTG